MDNSIMEYTAEDLISHKLTRGEILVAKPKFDQRSTDLLGLLTVGDGAKFCRIQCKGRTLGKTPKANVKVFTDDVTDAFVLFLFVEMGDRDDTHLFVFFGSEIRKRWTKSGEGEQSVYRLSFTKSNMEGKLAPYRFTDSRLQLIRRLIEQAEIEGEFAALMSTGKAHLTAAGARCNVQATFVPPVSE